MKIIPTATLLETIQQYSSTAVGSFERTLDTALHDAGTGPTPFFSYNVRLCAQFQLGGKNIDQWWRIKTSEAK